jgi:uncharacterized RDD family membrane protein YckC
VLGRRTLAFCLDAILIGIVGVVLGSLWFEALAELGDWGRLIGASFAALYFGIMNSRLAGGQTLGKRLLRVRVVGCDGRAISLLRSLVRVSVPLLAFGWTRAPFSSQQTPGESGTFAAFAWYGLGGAFLYLVLLTAGSRRSVHDLAAGSWVVGTGALKPRALRPTAKPHLIAAGAWCLLVLGAILLTSHVTGSDDTLQRLRTIQVSIEQSLPVRQVSLTEGPSISVVRAKHARRVRQLDVSAVLAARPSSFEVTATEIARLVLDGGYDLGPRARLNVSVAYGYDILIATGWERRTYSFPPSEWKRRAAQRAMAETRSP